MPWWLTLLFYVGSFIISELLRPKPNIENAKPAGLGDFQFPTAEEGRAVPLVWGTTRINGPNVGWFGDLQAEPITERIKTGLFSSDRVVVGYQYTVGLQFLLCRGPLDSTSPSINGIGRIWVDDELLRDGAFIDSGAISIDQPEFFGEDSGGIVGTVRVYPGNFGQGQSTYLAAASGIDPTLLPNYRGTVHAVLEAMYIGNAPSIRPWNFEIRRVIDPLGVAGTASPSPELVNGQDCNPANVIYEIMTNSEWGLGITNIDLNSFRDAARTLAAEGNGYSRIIDSPQEAATLLSEIEQQIDGFLTQDPLTRQYQLRLVRETDYTSPITEMPLFDKSNILDFQFTRASWQDSVNQVRVQYTDREKQYQTSFALAQDMGNNLIQGEDNVVTTVNYPGVANRSLANKLAWRDIRTLAYPLAKGSMKVSRAYYDLLPGQVIRINWEPLNLELFARVNRIQMGTLEANELKVDFTEDIFETPFSTFADPTSTLWTPVDPNALPPVATRLWNLPPQYQTVGFRQQLGVMAVRANGLQTSYDVYYARTANIQSPLDDIPELVFNVNVSPFTPSALLRDAVPLTSGSPSDFDDDVLFLDNGTDMGSVDVTATVADLDADAPPNLALVDDEIIFFESVTTLGGGEYRLNGVRRGMLDTVPAAHDANARIWFFTYGIGVIEDDGLAVGQQAYARFVSNALGGTGVIEPSPITESLETVSVTNRYQGAGPPVNPHINGIRIDEFQGGLTGGLLEMTWGGRNVIFGQDRTGTHESASEDPGGGTSYTVRIYHTGTSPETLVRTQSGIPYAGTNISPAGAGYNASGYLYDPDTVSPLASPKVPQTYRIEIEARKYGYVGQSWTGEVTVTGWGLSWGGDSDAGVVLAPGDASPSPEPANPVEGGYGGINFEGALLAQGSAPLVVEPIPGLTNPSVLTIDIGGTFNSLDDGVFRISFFNSISGAFESSNFTIDASTLSPQTLEAYAAEVGSRITDDLDPEVVSVSVVGTRVTVSTFYGSLSGSVQPGPVGTVARARIVQPYTPGSSNTGIVSSVALDYYLSQFDPVTGAVTDILAPSFDANYGDGQLVTTRVRLNGLDYASRKRLKDEANQPNQGYLFSATAPSIGATTYGNGVFQDIYDDLSASEVANFASISGPFVLNSGGGAQPPDFPQERAGIVISCSGALNQNFFVEQQFYANTDPNTGWDAKLLWKTVRIPRGNFPSGLPQVTLISFAEVGSIVAGDEYQIQIGAYTVSETSTAADVSSQSLLRIYEALRDALRAVGPLVGYDFEVLTTSANIPTALEVIGPLAQVYSAEAFIFRQATNGIEVTVTED